MTLQKLQCIKCSKVQYVRSKTGTSKSHFTCSNCKRNDAKNKSESPKEGSNEVEA